MYYSIPITAVGKVIVDNCLTVTEDVNAGDIVIEYNGNRVDARVTIVMHHEMDTLVIKFNLLLRVLSERASIDPRGCGNMAICVNHKCITNDRLLDVVFGNLNVVMIQALVSIACVVNRH